MHVPIETVLLEALDAVQIEADLQRVNDARASVVLMHPHPLYGGDRFNPLIESLFRTLPALGATTIRFDFRGVNNSGGAHDNGDSERLDVVAAIELLELIEMDRDIPLWLIGYSFGAYVALNVVDPRVAGWVAIAPPLATMNSRCIADQDHRSKLLLVPEHDQFSSPSATAEFTRDWVACAQHTIPMADHFMSGRVDAVTQLVGHQVFGAA
jgi:alpha/beta superfamily hydrolase